MKYFFFLLFTLLFFVQPVHALTATQIINNGVASRSIYSNEVDALVLDVTAKPARDEMLTMLVVENTGQPPAGIRIGGLSLWTDSQEQGYQGWEQDTLVASTTDRDGERWTFSNLALPLKAGGTRLLVTATVGTIRDRIIPIQFGMWVGNAMVGADMLFLNPSVSVQVQPQSAILAPASGANLAVDTLVKISGKARSRGGALVQTVQVRAAPLDAVSSTAWTTVQATGPRFSVWEYEWTPKQSGTYRIESRASDENALVEEPHGITVTVPAPPPPSGIPLASVPFLGTLVKRADDPAVYYVGSSGKRYAFPNANIYHSWYPDFRGVQTLSAEQFSSLALGGVVTYRPGTRLVKIQTDPKVYAVSRRGVLRWITTELVATKYFGPAWASLVDDLPDAFFSHYTLGEPLTESTFYDSVQQQEGSKTIGQDKGL